MKATNDNINLINNRKALSQGSQTDRQTEAEIERETEREAPEVTQQLNMKSEIKGAFGV